MAQGTPIKDIDIVVMAIRERLMGYYKGGTDLVIDHPNISVGTVHIESQFRYQRLRAQQENKQMLRIGTINLFEMHLSPDTIIFHNDALERSADFREIRDRIDRFMSTYLPSVIKE